MTNMRGTCAYCGQQKLIEVPNDFTPEEVDREATYICNCPEAKVAREKREKEEALDMAKTSAKGTTYELFHEDFPEIEKVMNLAIDAVACGRIKSMTIKAEGKITGIIKKQSDSILVKRKEESEYKRETVL